MSMFGCVPHMSLRVLLTATPRLPRLGMRFGSCYSAVAERPARARQDMGPGYRNVIGIPGGVRSPLFKVLQVRDPAPAFPKQSRL